MPLSAEQLEMVEAFVKEAQDFARANIIDAFLMKHGTLNANVGDNVIGFSDTGTDPTDHVPYDDTNYIITIIEAIDGDGIDVKGELEITNKTVNGFTINCLTACTIKWHTSRPSPKINFWT